MQGTQTSSLCPSSAPMKGVLQHIPISTLWCSFQRSRREQGQIKFSIYPNSMQSKLFPQFSLIHVLWGAVSPPHASHTCVFRVVARSLVEMEANADMVICALMVVLKLIYFTQNIKWALNADEVFFYYQSVLLGRES